MRLDLVDLLRCPNDHVDTPLVCVAGQSYERELVAATLGCPECRAEFVVRDGVAWLGAGAGAGAAAVRPATPEEAPRLAAMLDLATPGGTVAVSGGWASSAHALALLAGVTVVVLDDDAHWIVPGLVSVLAGTRGIPLARGALRGIALGEASPAELDARLASASGVLAHHGRLVAPVSCVAPPACHVLARDDRWWVAERRDAVSLRRAPRHTPGR